MFKLDAKLIAASALVTLALMAITSSLGETTRAVLVAAMCVTALVVQRTLK
jgi:hypothetical protein